MSQLGAWWSKNLFNFVHGNNLVYNTCWEDPRLDRIALNIGSEDRIAMITSAGCNALDYALDEPEAIYCIDVNPRQNHLLNLKIAGIKALDFETFFQIFGTGSHPEFEAILNDQLADHLSDDALKYWRKNSNYFTCSRWRPTFYFYGTSGLVARLMGHYLDLRAVKDSMASLWNTTTIEQQQAIYDDYIKDTLWTEWMTWISKKEITMSLLGVPKAQLAQVQNEYSGGMAKFIQDCVESVFTKVPLRDNYFWWLYFSGSYLKDRCPEYLKESNFNKLKAGLVDRVSTSTMTLVEFFKQTQKPISKFVLLDHMDWLYDNNRKVLHQEWQGIVDASRDNSQVIWRSAGLMNDFVDPIRVAIANGTSTMGDLLKYNRDLAAELHQQDRVHTYGSFYIAQLKH